jgi:hypothetical protein
MRNENAKVYALTENDNVVESNRATTHRKLYAPTAQSILRRSNPPPEFRGPVGLALSQTDEAAQPLRCWRKA